MRKFSYTRINTFVKCPWSYKMRYIDNLTLKKRSAALAMGSCIATGLAEYRTSGNKSLAIERLIKSAIDGGLPLQMEDPVDTKAFRSVERGAQILNNYMENYPDEPDHIFLTEKRFVIPVFDDIVFEGKIDAIDKIQNEYVLIEDKTTSRLGETYFNPFKKSSQISWYLMAVCDLGLLNVPKCKINAIYVHPKEFRLRSDITIKSKDFLECCRENLKQIIKLIILVEERELFLRNDIDGNECIKYNGCDYLPLCNSRANPEMVQRLIEAEYEAYHEKEIKTQETAESEKTS